nr:Fic family protein [uncultured Rhodopila sp.]
MSDDPYVYPGTDVLINREAIRDRSELEVFERVITANRMEHLPRNIPLTARGYRQIHRHIFESVYAWAGKDRTVNITKGGHMFCLVPYIASNLDQRFAAIHAENKLIGTTRNDFVARAAVHVSELNAIHPFREGNGRTVRAWLQRFGETAGHPIALERISPQPWINASIGSFRHGDYAAMREVISRALID